MQNVFIYKSPIGNLYLYEEEGFLNAISNNLKDNQACIIKDNIPKAISLTTSFLDGYFKGENIKIDIPLKYQLSNFQQVVLKECFKVPYGQVISYKELGNRVKKVLNKEMMSNQAIGTALHKNPYPIYIPCHRIIKSNGTIGEYAWGKDIKKSLLDIEKVNYKM